MVMEQFNMSGQNVMRSLRDGAADIIFIVNRLIEEVSFMATTRNIVHAEMAGHRPEIRRALENSLEAIRIEMKESGATCYVGSAEWRAEVAGLIDHLHKELFYLSEPRGSGPDEHRRLRELRATLHDLYRRELACG